MDPSNRIKTVLCILLTLMGLLCFHSERIAFATPSSTAKQIRETSGFEGGLVIHLGCSDGKLTAALGMDSNHIVHGLDRDPEQVKKARRFIWSQGRSCALRKPLSACGARCGKRRSCF